MALSKLEKGRVGEAALIYVAAREGWGIALPHLCELPYDVAIKINNKQGWAKVQCKFAGVKRAKNLPSVDLRTGKGSKKKYPKGAFEYLFAYDLEWQAGWLIPFNLIKTRTEITPRLQEFEEYRVL